MQQLAGSKIQRPSQIVLLVLSWGHHLFLRPLRHPGGPDLRQQMNIEFIRKNHHFMRLQVFLMKPNTG